MAGIVIVNSKQDVQHQGIYLAMEGCVSLQLSAKSVGLFEAFYSSLKVRRNMRPLNTFLGQSTLDNALIWCYHFNLTSLG